MVMLARLLIDLFSSENTRTLIIFACTRLYYFDFGRNYILRSHTGRFIIVYRIICSYRYLKQNVRIKIMNSFVTFLSINEGETDVIFQNFDHPLFSSLYESLVFDSLPSLPL